METNPQPPRLSGEEPRIETGEMGEAHSRCSINTGNMHEGPSPCLWRCHLYDSPSPPPGGPPPSTLPPKGSTFF